MLTREGVRDLFSNLETGHGDVFFESVRDDVDWIVMGTHPLAGEYHSKDDFRHATFTRLNTVLKDGVVLQVVGVHVDGNVAIVELRALSTANNGKPFDNTYCWICTFDENDMISKVRAYVDSALVAQVIEENEQ